MNRTLRKINLTIHVAASVEWLGAVLAYLPFAIRSVSALDAEAARMTYGAMEVIGWSVIVPCGVAALVTGLIQSLGTSWGLFRFYWIVAKFILTVGGITILLMHMPLVSRLTQNVNQGAFASAALPSMGKSLLIHAAGGLAILTMALGLSVFKPCGPTGYGRRKLRTGNIAFQVEAPAAVMSSKAENGSKDCVLIAILVGISVVLAFAILHHLRGGVPSH